MALTREEALNAISDASLEYVGAQAAEAQAHAYLKRAIRAGIAEAKLTQQDAADATAVEFDDDTEFGLSRQRISQIIHEKE